ncbi:putative ABC transporter permease [Anaerovorax odorimutans]|uniref:ABC transporter permease n=1 Tax=Anaerovorax odorimutans TaxID=109327 RepID=A0ABT1RT02_9FIRM|nr:putative ABC transporter permease [Anaerovorax odorimutans]MCQ4638266.1 putative ABC transporter permease [Anaerovorax odorimutans]
MQRVWTGQTSAKQGILLSVQVYSTMFLAFSVIGWICEELFCRTIDGYWENRGFLYGPYLPIYGIGAVVICMLFRRFRDRPVTLFVLAGLFCSLLEYITGWAMESIWGRTWWDYSEAFLNIQGRVCLRGALLFAAAGILLIYLIEPAAKKLIFKYMDTRKGQVFFIAFWAVFTADLVLTVGGRYS